MSDGPPPDTRSWKTRLLLGVVHSYFAVARGMTIGVRAACFDSEGRLFLVRHSYVPGWHMPGGGLERFETVEQALAKELREEGNLIMTARPELFHVYFNTLASRRDHVVFYRTSVDQTKPRPPDREIVESGFFELDELPAGTTPSTLRRLAELRGEQPPSAYW